MKQISKLCIIVRTKSMGSAEIEANDRVDRDRRIAGRPPLICFIRKTVMVQK